MRLLVTGIMGFVGRHALAFLRAEHPQVEVLGLVRSAPVADPRFECFIGDLTDRAGLARELARARPDRILHLAGESSPASSLRHPLRTLNTNVVGTLNLLEAACELARRPRLLVIGSAEEYGVAPAPEGRSEPQAPLTEGAPLHPITPYGCSKATQGLLARRHASLHGLEVVLTRSFNHSGPGRAEEFAESSFARQIAQIEAGAPPVIRVGNLEAVRDFCDVRDVVRAYWRLLEKGRPGEVYNVCSGAGVCLREVLDRLLALSGVHVEERRDPQRMRPSDIPVLVGDPSKIQRETGWRPRVPLDQTLRDLLEDWRERVAAEARAPS